MLTHTQDPCKKRVLKKVRCQFLTKKTSDEPIDIDPATRYLNSNRTYTLSPSIGLVERNHELCFGPEFLNLYFKITSSKIEEQLNSKVITLYVSQNKDSIEYIPVEYTIKRLKSYGDLDLAVWAQKIGEHYNNLPKLMDHYFKIIYSNETEVLASLQEADMRVTTACDEIERNYPYYKLVHFITRTSEQLVSLSYNEDLLREIGHTVQSFIAFTKKNGIPSLFESNCQFYKDIIRKCFDVTLRTFGSPVEGPEFVVPLFGEDGSKREVLAQFVNFFRPAREGYFVYSYMIVKGQTCEQNLERQNVSKSVKRKVNTEEM